MALASTAALTFPLACSSGLDSDVSCSATPVGSASGNVTTGLFWGFDLKDPAGAPAVVEDQAIAGAIIPGVNPSGDRHVAFYAFATDAAADDAGTPGEGRRLDRLGLADSNGQSDVFLAAVVQERVDQNAFSYSLAGKFRHPRCVNCHSVVKEPGFASNPLSTVFAQSTHPTVEGVQAPQPGSGRFQNTQETSCLTCHESALDALGFEGHALGSGWRNPSLSANADFRLFRTSQLADAARSAPANHFDQDRRVTWALDTAFLPSRSVINGPFSAADDDHDGVLEPFDSDGRRRAVPGGSSAFFAEVDSFLCGDGADDTRRAIADHRLVSRSISNSAPDAGASEPDIAFVANSAFNPTLGGVSGTVYVAYSSTSTDIDSRATGGIRQIYRAAFEVVVGTDGPSGSVRLRYQGTDLVTTDGAGTAAGNADSSSPSISSLPSAALASNAGARIAFVSDAANLGSTGGPGAVHLSDLSTGEIIRVNDVLIECTEPSIDPTGQVVAFVTAEADLTPPTGVLDTNGVADVYFMRVSSSGMLAAEANFPQRASRSNGDPGESETAPCTEPDVSVSNEGTVLVAFTSGSELDANGIEPSGTPAATNVFVHAYTGIPGNSPERSTRQASLSRSLEGTLQFPDGASRHPSFPGRGDRLVFETDATNLDSAFTMPPDPEFGVFTSKSGDENSGPDIVMTTLAGIVDGSASARTVALSVSPAGAFGDGSTLAPVASGFVSGVDTGQVLVAGLTLSRNLGAADNHAGLTPLEPTPWMSFAVDTAAAPTSRFERTSSVLRSRCMPCHAPGGSNAAPFSLGADDSALFTALTTLTRNCPTPTSYVVPNDADASLIVQVMEGSTCSLAQMPQGLAAVPQSLVDVVRDWIDNGALQND